MSSSVEAGTPGQERCFATQYERSPTRRRPGVYLRVSGAAGAPCNPDEGEGVMKALVIALALAAAPAALSAQSGRHAEHALRRCVRDRVEDVRDRREDRRDRREDVRDRAEDRWDRRHHGGARDRREDVRERREDRRDRREDRRDRAEDYYDRRHGCV